MNFLHFFACNEAFSVFSSILSLLVLVSNSRKIVSSFCCMSWSSSTNSNFLHRSLFMNPSFSSGSPNINTNLARTGDIRWKSTDQNGFFTNRISCVGENVSLNFYVSNIITYLIPLIFYQYLRALLWNTCSWVPHYFYQINTYANMVYAKQKELLFHLYSLQQHLSLQLIKLKILLFPYLDTIILW